MTYKLPLFPLNTVLFPGLPISLHIFEERYRLMIARCIEQNGPFGVVLIREGPEVGGEAAPYPVGTTAVIGDNVRLEDGRYYLTATGQRRFRIQYIAQRQPYILASVAYLSEETGGPAVIGQANELRELYGRYWNALAAATGHRREPEKLPEGAIDLTYWMAHRLQIDNVHKQRWLEADVSTRLREMSAAIRTELRLLPGNAAGDNEREWAGPGSWN
ncbi:MAG TPA: LON peptidase substrate-binding domain-containing protein [Roseiflexaceae bacterium]|nr:LON peptidase substrate-binding domain-containing protein [Roseiflexaceae bacterium]